MHVTCVFLCPENRPTIIYIDYYYCMCDLSTVTYPHLLQGLGQHVAALLLVDEDDDGRLETMRQHLQQLLPAPQKTQRL